jgi:hypothetical protein
MKKVLQVLFSRPLQYEDGVLYGVRVPYDEIKAKRLFDYAVEGLIGQWCFTQNHGGEIEDFSKWIDLSGKIYNSGASTRLYAYTAALDTRTYFRIDEWMVDDNCDLDNEVEITDATEYFNTRCILDEQDYKTGYNGWLQIYQRLLSRYQTLTQRCLDHTGMLLDYDEQEDTFWMSKILE